MYESAGAADWQKGLAATAAVEETRAPPCTVALASSFPWQAYTAPAQPPTLMHRVGMRVLLLMVRAARCQGPRHDARRPLSCQAPK